MTGNRWRNRKGNRTRYRKGTGWQTEREGELDGKHAGREQEA